VPIVWGRESTWLTLHWRLATWCGYATKSTVSRWRLVRRWSAVTRWSAMTKGKAIQTLHWVGDELWELDT